MGSSGLGSYFLKEQAVPRPRGYPGLRTSKFLIQFKQILREHALGGWAYIGANRESVQFYPGYNAWSG
jgi:hypothetical protein